MSVPLSRLLVMIANHAELLLHNHEDTGCGHRLGFGLFIFCEWRLGHVSSCCILTSHNPVDMARVV